MNQQTKTVGILNPRPALEINYKITAIDSFENIILSGDEKGNIYRYQATPEDTQIIQANSMNKQIAKSRIEQIKFLPALKDGALILADQLYYVSSGAGLQTELVYKEKIRFFTVNDFPRPGTPIEIIAITKNKEGVVLVFTGGKWEQQKEKFQVPMIPSAIAFMGSQFFLALPERSYSVMNLDEKQLQVRPLNIPIAAQAFMKPTDADELFVLTPNNIGIFIGRDGMPKQKGAINLLNNKPIISITTHKGYLLVMYDNVIQIHNINDASRLPEINILNQQYKCITYSCNKYLFYASGSEIVFLRQTPPEQQISELLSNARVDDAIKVFQQQIAPFDVNRETKLDQINLDCAWSLIRNLQFPEALKYLNRTNFDPRDLICLFPLYIIQVKKLQSLNDNPSKMQMNLHIQTAVQELPALTKDKNELGKRIAECNAASRELLVGALEKRRTTYTSTQLASSKDKLHLISSPLCINQNQWQALSVEDMLEIVDYALIMAYCDQQQYENLRALFKGNTIYCLSMYKQLKDKVYRIGGDAQWAIAPRFEESFQQIDAALDSWKLIAETTNEKVWTEACQECVRILQQNQDRNKIFKHLGWVLKKSMVIGAKLFEYIDENLITPVQMQKYIEEMDLDVNSRRNLREKYLEVLVLQRNIEDEVLHTQLAKCYIDIIFQISPPSAAIGAQDWNNLNLKSVYQKFKDFINNPKAKYNSSSILADRVRDSWMVHEIISLYGREKRHDEALTKLIELGEYLWAESYCCEHNDNLLTKLFRKYIDIYNKLQVDQKHEAMRRTNLETINNFLKKYATHQQLNPLEVLDIIPERWVLSNSENEEGLNCFLNSVISHSLHQRRATGAAKHLQEMDLLNCECQYASAKRAYVRITTEKKCAVCTRSIGDKVFVVYPNAVVAHHTCIKNNTVCPKTEKDFEKYFKF